MGQFFFVKAILIVKKKWKIANFCKREMYFYIFEEQKLKVCRKNCKILL